MDGPDRAAGEDDEAGGETRGEAAGREADAEVTGEDGTDRVLEDAGPNGPATLATEDPGSGRGAACEAANQRDGGAARSRTERHGHSDGNAGSTHRDGTLQGGGRGRG